MTTPPEVTWRGWLSFVFAGNQPEVVAMDDAEFKEHLCELFDKQTIEAQRFHDQLHERKQQLLTVLARLKGSDPELAHARADDALLEFINDAEILAAFQAIEKWYA